MRAGAFGQRHHIGKRHQPAAARAHKDILQIIRRKPRGIRRLQQHLIFLPTHDIGGDFARSHQGFNSPPHGGDGNAKISGLPPINIHAHFRLGFLEVVVKVQQARIGARLFQKHIAPSDQRIIIRPTDHELQRRLEAALTKRWRVQGKAANAWNARHQGEDFGSNRLLLAIPLVPGGEAHKDIRDIANGWALKAAYSCEDRIGLAIINVFLQQAFQADHMFSRIGKGSALRPRGRDDDYAAVFSRRKFLGQCVEQHHSE